MRYRKTMSSDVTTSVTIYFLLIYVLTLNLVLGTLRVTCWNRLIFSRLSYLIEESSSESSGVSLENISSLISLYCTL